ISKFRYPRMTTLLHNRIGLRMTGIALAVLFALSSTNVQARPAPKAKKGGQTELSFRRQKNQYSNLDFNYTNRGVLFNSGSLGEGLFWPRASKQSYIFGQGLWFATKKDIQGKRRKLCDIGYNPNSGLGWYEEGEANEVGDKSPLDGANHDAKY